MRIIGGRDYYDSAMGYGIDKTLVFVRHKEKEELPEFLPQTYFDTPIGDVETKAVQVYFCGTLYLGISIQLPKEGFRLVYNPPKKECIFWDMKSLKKSIEKYKITLRKYEEADLHRYFEKSGREGHRQTLIEKRITIATLVKAVKRYNWNSENWKIDGFNLKSLQFYKVKNAFEAFQEISMWIGGVLPHIGTNPPQIVDEKIRLSKRGFDPKWSFRKEP